MMTFEEKLKHARLNANMSQEELTLKVSVSRSAIAKWETDRGLPDVQNLKAIIAYALDISLDYLLEDGTALDLSVVREAIDLSKFTNVFRSFLAVKRQDVAVIFRFSAQDIVIEALFPINIVNACLQRDHLLEQVFPLDCQDGLSFRY